MKLIISLLLIIPSLSWGLTFKDGKQVEDAVKFTNSPNDKKDGSRSDQEYSADNYQLIRNLLNDENPNIKIKRYTVLGAKMESSLKSWNNHGKHYGTIEVMDRKDLAFNGSNFFHITASFDQCDDSIILEYGKSQCDSERIRNEYNSSSNDANFKFNETMWLQFAFKPANNIILDNPLYRKLFFITQCAEDGAGYKSFALHIRDNVFFAKAKLLIENKGLELTDFPLMVFDQNKINKNYGYDEWIKVRLWLSLNKGFQIWVNDELKAEYSGKIRGNENDKECIFKQGLYVNASGYKNDPTRNDIAIWFDQSAIAKSEKQLDMLLLKDK